MTAEPLTPADLDRLRAVRDAATDGPWETAGSAIEQVAGAIFDNWLAAHDARLLDAAKKGIEGERADDELTRGRWSNGDPVHLIVDGQGGRRVAPNTNGATWIPER